MVPKRDGTNYLCIEFRKLNANTIKDSFPIMRINEVLSSFYWANSFSSVDKLKTDIGKYRWFKDEKKKTTFTTLNGLYQFKVLLFGLCNAPWPFQRFMHHILRKHISRFCPIYMDDVSINVWRSYELPSNYN